VQRLLGATLPRSDGATALAAQVRAARSAEVELPLLVHAGPAARGVPRKLLSVALVRALLGALPELVPLFRRHGKARFDAGAEPVWLEGQDVLAPRWLAAARPPLERAAADPTLRAAVDARLGAWGRWLGLAPAGWAPTRFEYVAPFAARVEPFLLARGVKHTRRRVGDGAYALELPREARKKGLLVQLGWRLLPDGQTELVAVPGPKLHPEELARHGFALPEAAEWVRVRCIVHGPPEP
jgi:hypothetical protein